MLIKATTYIKKNGYSKKVRYIIIDEYQDTSLVRFNLIREILKSTNANLMVVGDDFQSIYRFTGCDINLFLRFNKYFPNSKSLKIMNTYRNSKELIYVAGNFVMKNKRQIRKKMKSNKSINKPIEIVYYKDLNKTIKSIVKDLDNDYLILGRNNNDINLLSDDLKNKFLTVHKSKGLEANNIIIINLKNEILGFPNKIKDEKIFRLVLPKLDKYPYSEERRLFYVALTRTKNKVYLLINKNSISIFVIELIRNYKKYITIKKSML
jgi:DNA helicase-4